MHPMASRIIQVLRLGSEFFFKVFSFYDYYDLLFTSEVAFAKVKPVVLSLCYDYDARFICVTFAHFKKPALTGQIILWTLEILQLLHT